METHLRGPRLLREDLDASSRRVPSGRRPLDADPWREAPLSAAAGGGARLRGPSSRLLRHVREGRSSIVREGRSSIVAALHRADVVAEPCTRRCTKVSVATAHAGVVGDTLFRALAADDARDDVPGAADDQLPRVLDSIPQRRLHTLFADRLHGGLDVIGNNIDGPGEGLVDLPQHHTNGKGRNSRRSRNVATQRLEGRIRPTPVSQAVKRLQEGRQNRT
mmetsp:Transcript_12412/g.30988  ORF Transcript_12412/g.30988 Transcript_12412/m.30988 type:complete len:220 (-) Transcript_12412:11-670(-)